MLLDRREVGVTGDRLVDWVEENEGQKSSCNWERKQNGGFEDEEYLSRMHL